jgi:hypothetical protein
MIPYNQMTGKFVSIYIYRERERERDYEVKELLVSPHKVW